MQKKHGTTCPLPRFRQSRPLRTLRSPLARALQAAGLLGAALFAGSAGAVGLQGDNWTVDVGGIVNAYYTSVGCSGDAVGGPALASRALGCSGESHKTTIGNGLLPSGLITKFKTTQEGLDIGGTVGIMVHTATTSGIAANSAVDVRQAFFTVGTPEMGTFKLGRDYGIFGSGAILGDMTLLGVGAPTQATQRGRVTLGHIGAGYTYLDHYGQVAWTSPVFGGGLTFSGAVVSPVDAGNYVSKSYPQLQAQLAWSGEGIKVWGGVKAQKFYAASVEGNPVAGDNFTLGAGELGVSIEGGGFGFLANVQAGKGIGILTDGDEGDVKGINYFIQGTYKFTDKLKLGLNYGQSKNDDDDVYNDTYNGSFKSNENATLGLYYALTNSVTLVAEAGQTRSRDYADNTAKMWGGSLGGIIFF